VTTTLVSFLGRARQDRKTGYRQARYRFPDGQERTTAFFGIALREVLSPDRLVLLGTSGSMWDFLVEHLAPEGQGEEVRLRLIEAAIKERVTPELLSEVTPLVERALGLPCVLNLIAYGRNAAEQIAILDAIAGGVPEGRVILDLTHGFRHLAALGLLSGFFLERIARLGIDGLYYGALDMTDRSSRITPVVRLDGLLAVQRWIDALARFDQSGDYAVFTPLLIESGVPPDKARCLQDAAFHERNFNLSDARRAIQTFLPTLNGELAGAGRLFRDPLRKRLSWVKDGRLMDHQRRLAYFYLRNGDYVRAAILAYEAVVTHQCQRRGMDQQDYQTGREPATSLYESEMKKGRHSRDIRRGYWLLKRLRNSLAHGDPAPDPQVRRVIASRDRLPEEIGRTLDLLLS
jgi:CRISPR-associated Csx2 family protein